MATPNIWTVGTGKTFATISAAITAAGTVAGDFIEVYGNATNSYNEVVTVNKSLHVVGMRGWAGLVIFGNLGGNALVTLAALNASLGNFSIYNTSVVANSRACGGNSGNMRYYNCRMYNSLYGVETGAGGNELYLQNCLMDNNSGNGIYSVAASNNVWIDHCTLAKNALNGWFKSLGTAVGNSVLSAGNGADFNNISAASAWCVSGDLTAPGSGAVTGFNTADFVNFAGNDFRISPAARLTTKARIPGYSTWPTDLTYRRRPTRERVNFAGCYYGLEQPTWGVGELSGVA